MSPLSRLVDVQDPAHASHVITVVAAIIEREDQFLLTRRLRDTHLAGLWEFPGGKCDPGETHEACLVREIREELGARVRVGRLVLATTHAYSDRTVALYFYETELLDRPRALLRQDMRWVPRDQLTTLDFPDADSALIELLTKAQGHG